MKAYRLITRVSLPLVAMAMALPGFAKEQENEIWIDVPASDPALHAYRHRTESMNGAELRLEQAKDLLLGTYQGALACAVGPIAYSTVAFLGRPVHSATHLRFHPIQDFRLHGQEAASWWKKLIQDGCTPFGYTEAGIAREQIAKHALEARDSGADVARSFSTAGSVGDVPPGISPF